MRASRRDGGHRTSPLLQLLLPVMGIGIALAIAALLEVGLRLFGIGTPDPLASDLPYQRIVQPVLQPGTLADGTAVLRTADPRLPVQFVRSEKPPGTVRIFVFGGSAVAGLGYSPNVAFAAYLRRMLTELPDHRDVELVNLGIVALSSKQVRALAMEVLANDQPDLLIVYSGNNEFLEAHARKYRATDRSLWKQIQHRLTQTNLHRLLSRKLHGPPRLPRPRELASSDASAQRLTQTEILEHVTLTPREVAEQVDRYEANLEAIATTAADAQVPLLLMSVGTNWRWLGPDDDAEDGSTLVPEDPAAARQTLESVEARLRSAPDLERWELFAQRGRLYEALGDHQRAREDFRRALSEDPHLRRALDRMNERVAAVAKRHDSLYLDTVAALQATAPAGILGFEHFYDHVHFSPTGALAVASFVYAHLRDEGFLRLADDDTLQAFVDSELAQIEAASQDFLDSRRWLGFSYDKALLADRDLWKYDHMVQDLERRIRVEPEFRSLVYYGNARSFQQGRRLEAVDSYRAALRLREVPEVRENLERLLRVLDPARIARDP